jgi:hypothetical protein
VSGASARPFSNRTNAKAAGELGSLLFARTRTNNNVPSHPPKLRTDLDRRFQTEGDCAVLVIKDPLSREFFRLKEAEGFIAEQLDGETPLDEVAKAGSKEIRRGAGAGGAGRFRQDARQEPAPRAAWRTAQLAS